ncbi:MAG: 50S ribosomal protein L25 [Patescibacteria group bacterium]|nr:50S ribosomal protein L25 [Patescibacteria group bacterium]
MEKKVKLKVEKRTLFGKKAKKLIKEGYTLGNIYGRNFPSTAVSIPKKEFLRVYRVVKETGVFYLEIDGQELSVMVKDVQRHQVTDEIIHIDFRKIDLNEKIETEVPIKIIGQSKAVAEKGGVLLTQTNSITIEALPEKIPQVIEIDISSLKEIGQQIKVADLDSSAEYKIKAPLEKVIVSVVSHKEESTSPETTSVTPEIVTEKKEEIKQDKSNSSQSEVNQ